MTKNCELRLILKGQKNISANYRYAEIYSSGTWNDASIGYRYGEAHSSGRWNEVVAEKDRKFIGSIGIIRDVTERKMAGEALEKSEKKFRMFMENAVDLMMVMDKDFNFTYVNEAMARALGYSREELTGMNSRQILSKKDSKEDFKSKEEELIAKGSMTHEACWVTKDGEEIYGELNAVAVYDSDGKIRGCGAVFRDITKRKKAENELLEREKFNKALFEYNPIETIVVDLEGKIAMFNFAKRDSGTRLPNIGDVMYKDYAGKHAIDMYTELMECIGSGKMKEFLDMRYGDRVLSITIAPFPNGAIITSKDLTGRKKAEIEKDIAKTKAENLLDRLKVAHEELKAAQDELLRRERIATSGSLAAGVAHEIRNPLAIIGMTVQYLESKLRENDPKRELTEAIIRKVERLDRVTRELSNYGRSWELNARKHNLARCLNLNLALVKPTCRVQKIKIRKQYSKLPLIEMDDEQIDKAFLNILDNAIHAMPKGGVLTVTTQFDDQGKVAVIKIHNTGSTIEKRHISHIFEPFYTLRKGKGTGLGLSIAQNVVLRHGGEITIENNSSGKDKGVTFIIRLPFPPPPKKKGENIKEKYERHIKQKQY